MKLHSIAVENLASLYGEHRVDLDRDLDGAPLFLIVGPTGAGKSTLLDAVCLALFGATPRLPGTRGRAETDAAQVMSHGTGTARAEVVVSTVGPDGSRRRFRAVWSCRRARDRPDGNLQRPQRSLERVDEAGECLELVVSSDLQKEIDPAFETVLQGMAVEDFQRSVLLAQGEFAAFLKAGEDERATILERLTSTEVYRRIGARAADRKRWSEGRVLELERRLDGVQPLDQAAVEELEATRAAADAERRRLDGEIRRLDGAARWLAEGCKQAENREDLAARRRAWVDERSRAKPRLVRLEEDERLRPLEEPLQDVVKLEGRTTAERRRIQNDERRHQELVADLLRQGRRWRALVEARLVRGRGHAMANEKARALAEEAVVAAERRLTGARNPDAPGDLDRRLASLDRRQAAVQVLIRERRSHLDTLHKVLGLSEHRRDLSPGEPCPLCGSTEHPHRTSGELDAYDDELVAKSRTLRTALDDAEAERDRLGTERERLVADRVRAEAALERAVAEARTRATRLDDLAERTGERLDHLGAERDRIDHELEALRRRLEDETGGPSPAGVAEAVDPDLPSDELQRQARRAADAWTNRSKELERLQGGQAKARDTLRELDGELAEARERLDEGLAGAGLESREALVDRLLGDEERGELAALQRRLDNARAELDALDRQAAQAAAEHRQGRPEELPKVWEAVAGSDPPVEPAPVFEDDLDAVGRQRVTRAVELLGERSAELRRLRDEAVSAAARASQSLADHAARVERLAHLARELDEARSEHRVWSELHRLIGVRDGEKFKEFAQIVNLQDLVERANRHLESLAPRYCLAVARDDDGRPRLAFVVRDADLAEVERHLTNLSGGETFLVSLALALALADTRDSGFPIETLLLDEGFGTLDPRSLETVMETLERLHARSSTQIGLISHVEALRERVEARIVVDKLGSGRSTVGVELGAAKG